MYHVHVGEVQRIQSSRRRRTEEEDGISPGVRRKKRRKTFGHKARRRVGSKKTWHKCSECCRSFRNPSTLKLHQETHARERTHQCSLCGKAFCTARRLKFHQRIGKNPYRCKTCTASFGCKLGLVKHEATHTLEKTSHECVHCLRTFPEAFLLALHRKRHRYSGKVLCKFTVSRVLSVSEVFRETSALEYLSKGISKPHKVEKVSCQDSKS